MIFFKIHDLYLLSILTLSHKPWMMNSIDTIDTLVLDWIIRSGYLSTFRKLPTASEASDGGSLKFRAEICQLIRGGRILEAVERIEARNLADTPAAAAATATADSLKLTTTRTLSQAQSLNLHQILFILRLQHFIELVRQKNTPAALSYVQNNLMPAAAAGEFDEVFQEVIGVLAYSEPEQSPLSWLFEQPKRYSALSSLTNSSLHQIESKSSAGALIEKLLKQAKGVDGLVREIGGFGNDLDDRKWAEFKQLDDDGKQANFVKLVKFD